MKNGEYIEYYGSGEIFFKINYLDGKKHGEYINYYRCGLISIKCWYLGGGLHGECIHYFTNGELNYKSYYINGVDVTKLEWISYNRNLKLELIGL